MKKILIAIGRRLGLIKDKKSSSTDEDVLKAAEGINKRYNKTMKNLAK